AIIGPDGLRSRVREILIGDGAPQPVGHVSYRGVVPVGQVKDQSHFDDMVIWIGPNLHLVQYRLRGGTVMNNVATVVSGKFARGERHDYGGPEELAEVFSRTTPHVQEMLGYVGKDKNWVLHDRDPRPGWRRGRLKPSGRWSGFTGGSKPDRGTPPFRLLLLLVLVPPHHPGETGAEAHEQHQENGRGERVGLDRGLRGLGARGRKEERGDRSGKESFHGGLPQRPAGRRHRVNCSEPLAWNRPPSFVP